MCLLSCTLSVQICFRLSVIMFYCACSLPKPSRVIIIVNVSHSKKSYNSSCNLQTCGASPKTSLHFDILAEVSPISLHRGFSTCTVPMLPPFFDVTPEPRVRNPVEDIYTREARIQKIRDAIVREINVAKSLEEKPLVYVCPYLSTLIAFFLHEVLPTSKCFRNGGCC